MIQRTVVGVGKLLLLKSEGNDFRGEGRACGASGTWGGGNDGGGATAG